MRTRIARGVGSPATHQRVGTATTKQGVRPGPAVQAVDIGITGQDVGLSGTDHIGNANQHVAIGRAAHAGSRREADDNGIPRKAVVGHVIAAAAIEGVVAGSARQRVVAATAVEDVVVCIAGEDIALERPGDILDVQEDIVLGIAPADRPAKNNGDGLARRRIVSRVGIGTALERVGTGPAGQRVRADAAVQQVGSVVAREHVRKIGTTHVGNADELVPLRRSADARPEPQVDRDRAARCCVIGRVRTATAHQRVVAEAADERVITRAAVDEVVVGVADEAVGTGRAGQVLDVDKSVACRIAASGRRGAKIDRHGRRAGIVERIDAAAAINAVCAGSAGQHVVAGGTEKRIRANAARQRIGRAATIQEVVVGIAGQRVGLAGADEIEDLGEHVALGISADAGAGAQVDRDGLPGRRVVRHVAATAALQRIGTTTTDEGIGTRATVQQIAVAVTRQQVGRGRADEVADRLQLIAGGLTARSQAGDKTDGNCAAVCRVIDGVDPTAANQGVGAGASEKDVITAAAIQDVVVGVALKAIVLSGSDHVRDQDQPIILGVTAGSRAADEVDRNPLARSRIVCGIDATTAGQGVRAETARQRIVAQAAIDAVVAEVACQ